MHYTENNDVFALGCLIVELYLGFEAFQGNDTIDQLNKIFAVLGTPNDNNWYEGARLIHEKQIRFPEYDPIDLTENIPGASVHAIDLLSKVLEINPKKRISIFQVLAHPYFSDVKPDLPLEVLDYEAKMNTSSFLSNAYNKSDTAVTGAVSSDYRNNSQRQLHFQKVLLSSK
jgi:serine/threonine protein kinase